MAGNSNSGNRTARRGHPTPTRLPQNKRRVTIGDDILVQLYAVAPGIAIKPLVEALVLEFIIKTQKKKEDA